MASVSSTRIGMSQTRISSVSKNGCGRTSHQIFLALSMQLVRTSRLTKFSKSDHDVNVSGMFVRGKRSNTLHRYDFRPVFMPIQNGRVGREREQVRQEVPHLVHELDERLAVFDADVHVQAEDQVRARDDLHVLDELQVSLVRVDVLDAPVGERMGRARREKQAVLVREREHAAPQVAEVHRGVADGLADAGADFDDRLVHLGLDALVQLAIALRDDLGLDVRAEIVRIPVDRLVFLFDPDREGWRRHGVASAAQVRRRNSSQRYVSGRCGASAVRTASSAIAWTIQSKFSSPTDRASASGAGFMKSIA